MGLPVMIREQVCWGTRELAFPQKGLGTLNCVVWNPEVSWNCLIDRSKQGLSAPHSTSARSLALSYIFFIRVCLIFIS